MEQEIKIAPRFESTRWPPLRDGGTPTWEVAYLFPAQGHWTEFEFFNLDRFCDGIPRIELSNGRLTVLPMPTEFHQLIMVFLFDLFRDFTELHAPGIVLPAGMRVKLHNGKIRLPDIVYMKAANAHRRRQRFWKGADLVVEIVSGDAKDIQRDWETKSREYARAGIPEYWIVDPHKQIIQVLTLRRKIYKVHGEFGPGSKATSVLLPGFSVSVDDVFAAGGNSEEE
jgi:Uma2 family endonuclease